MDQKQDWKKRQESPYRSKHRSPESEYSRRRGASSRRSRSPHRRNDHRREDDSGRRDRRDYRREPRRRDNYEDRSFDRSHNSRHRSRSKDIRNRNPVREDSHFKEPPRFPNAPSVPEVKMNEEVLPSQKPNRFSEIKNVESTKPMGLE